MSLILFRGKPGEELGDRFRLLAELGKGSFGEVWQARRLKDGATVAIKIPKDQEKGEEVLRKESEIVKDIQHPNIVRVHGFHKIGELFVIEMEFVDGYDLAKVLDSVSTRAPLTFEQMLEWTLQILDGLAAVHAANVSHNDLKPQNILVDKASGAAKITDFGSSRRLEDVWVWTQRHGTEAYMAPEVALEGRRARDVSDIYSIGVLLYEMATGRLPYSSPHQLLTGVQIAKPREINRDVPADLEELILRAMSPRPEGRFPNCRSMRAAVLGCLERLQAEANIAAMPARSEPSQLGFRPPPSSPLHYLELAKQRLAESDAQGALEAAEAAVDRSNGHPQYLRMLGGICVRLGYHRRAAEVYEQLLAAFDRGYSIDAHQRREVFERLGQLYIYLQRYGEAVGIYERLVHAVDRPYSRFRLAVAAGLDGDYSRAIELLESVRAERPDAVVVYSKLGWAHALNGSDRLALSFYNQALTLDAFDLFSLFELGKYYYMVGDRRRAREYFERVMDADVQGSYAGRVREFTNPTA
ncbi:serine/threonine-protein kinase [Burkholderia sp. Ac-20349]|uniref:serine/threonine-protein kinase n=1 Tax=Burkholderia sp. Ac-20349 TaxID=2703893 RepID=UPI00197CA1FD|nr:serine/threonine-protein kinase [Burkholderia sp. Ac-20349]MBN3840982.1 protein kinase [Burkholderia sp. Ac-20349]